MNDDGLVVAFERLTQTTLRMIPGEAAILGRFLSLTSIRPHPDFVEVRWADEQGEGQLTAIDSAKAALARAFLSSNE